MKNRKKIITIGIVMTLILILLTSCGKEEVKKESNNETQKVENKINEKEEVKDSNNLAIKEAEEKLFSMLEPLPEKDTKARVGAIESTLANSFWLTMQEGYEDAAKEYGVDIEVKATDAEDDLIGQLEIMETMISKKFDAICISSLTEQNLIPGIVEANNSDIKIVTVGNSINEEALNKANGIVEAHITSDFKKQGEIGAEYIVKEIGGKGKVAVIEGIPGATQSEARKNGALEIFEKEGLDILEVQTGEFDRQKAYDITLALIEGNPDLKGISCGNDVMALGAVEALKSKGKLEDVVVVGVDFIEEAKESIEKGELSGSVAMSPYLFGKGGLIMSLKVIQGHEIDTDVIWTPIQLVTIENLNEMEGWK